MNRRRIIAISLAASLVTCTFAGLGAMTVITLNRMAAAMEEVGHAIRDQNKLLDRGEGVLEERLPPPKK